MNRIVNAEMVRRIMHERNMSPTDLAREGQVCVRTAYRLLNEPNARITGATAGRLAAALGCPVNLITRQRPPAGNESNT